MKIVIVSPHRDDAAFSLGLAIEAWIAAGHRVTVLDCFTRSEYAPFSDVSSLHPNDRRSFVTALRGREEAAWAKPYGSRLSFLDLRLKDAPLRLHRSPDEVCTLPPTISEKVTEAIRKGLRQVGGEALVLPLALGGHVDHVTAHEAALQVSPRGGPFAFYEDLPYAARPGEAAGIPDAAVRVALALGEPIWPGFVPDAAVLHAAERKRSMALHFDSQIDSDGVEAIAGFTGRYGGRERLWANAAWRRVLGLEPPSDLGEAGPEPETREPSEARALAQTA